MSHYAATSEFPTLLSFKYIMKIFLATHRKFKSTLTSSWCIVVCHSYFLLFHIDFWIIVLLTSYTLLSSCRFREVTYLQQAWWFGVDGAVKFPLLATSGTLSVRLHLGKVSHRLGRQVCSFEHTHGWDIKLIQFKLSTSDGQQALSGCRLAKTGQDEVNGTHKCCCWDQYKAGEFRVTSQSLQGPSLSWKFGFQWSRRIARVPGAGSRVRSVHVIISNLRDCWRRGVTR